MTTDDKKEKQDLKCPECHALLRKRRTRKPDECEMYCGGCGAAFDVCDMDTLQKLKDKNQPQNIER